MSCVYWIDDEIYRLDTARELLEEIVGEVRIFTNAVKVRDALNQIRAERGPIILDLWIPTGDTTLPAELQKGPRVGLRLLEELRSNLGADWPIFIVSGNLSLEITEELLTKYRIPRNHIFSKPLNRKSDVLIEGVMAAATPPARPVG